MVPAPCFAVAERTAPNGDVVGHAQNLLPGFWKRLSQDLVQLDIGDNSVKEHRRSDNSCICGNGWIADSGLLGIQPFRRHELPRIAIELADADLLVAWLLLIFVPYGCSFINISHTGFLVGMVRTISHWTPPVDVVTIITILGRNCK